MEISLEEFVQSLDFEQFNYYYHETGLGAGSEIMLEGLDIEGTNILDVDNILFTTTRPFTLEDAEEIDDLVESERSAPGVKRVVSEMVILEVEKGMEKAIVGPPRKYGYEGNVSSKYVKGYIDMYRHTFIVNVYANDYDR